MSAGELTAGSETKLLTDGQPPKSDDGQRKKPNITAILLVAILVVLLILAGGIFYLAHQMGDSNSKGVQTATTGTQPQGYTTDQNRGTLISKDAYKVGQSFEKYGFKVTVDAVKFTGTDTQVYVTVKNEDTRPIEFMANENSSLTDDNGQTYNVQPFDGENEFNGTIPPNGTLSGYIDFEPVNSSAKSLQFDVPHVFDMNHPSFEVKIPFDIPGK